MSMGTKRKKGYVPRRSWSIFDREAYHWAWVDKTFFGVFDCFRKDMRYCRQRIKKGYCDADLYSIYDWFLETVPAMLEQYKKTRHGSPGILGENYENEDGILVNDTCHREWDTILDRMIFLFREADESSCQKKNPYEDGHMKMLEEFAQKYGHFGEMLETAEEKEERTKTGAHVVHFPSEIPEYVDVDERYYAEEKKLEEYRNQCKEEAFQLFSEWFFHLWD